MSENLDFVHPDMVVCIIGTTGYGVIAKRLMSGSKSPSPGVIFRKGDLLVDCGPIVVQIDDDGKGGRLCSGCGKAGQNQKLMRCGSCKVREASCFVLVLYLMLDCSEDCS